MTVPESVLFKCEIVEPTPGSTTALLLVEADGFKLRAEIDATKWPKPSGVGAMLSTVGASIIAQFKAPPAVPPGHRS